MKTSVPFINNGKSSEEFLNVRNMISLPSDTPFGNLNRKGILIVLQIDQVNLKIREIFRTHSSISSSHEEFAAHYIAYEMKMEELVYWLKTIADEIVSTISLLWTHAETGGYPTTIEVQQLGELEGRHSKHPIAKALSQHLLALSDLNEVSNAFKHSIVQSDATLFGTQEPVVYALPLKYNNLAHSTDYRQISVRDLVSCYNLFYVDGIQMLRSLADRVS